MQNENNKNINIQISKEILNILPSFNVQAYSFPIEVIENDESMVNGINEEIKKCIDKYNGMDLEKVINLECIKEGRDGYKKLGKDPSRYRLACESLLRRLAKGNGLYYINNAVDLGNILSINLNRSVAVLDLDKIEGDVFIRIGRSDDIYEGIGRGLINISNIPVYCDNVGPFGSPTSDTLRTAVSLDTKNILLFIISFSDKYLKECENEFIRLYTNYANVRKEDIKQIKVIK